MQIGFRHCNGRVKELKGDSGIAGGVNDESQYQADYEEEVDGVSDVEMEDTTEYNEPFIIDTEFPPDNMILVDDLNPVKSKTPVKYNTIDEPSDVEKHGRNKVSILEKLNAHKLKLPPSVRKSTNLMNGMDECESPSRPLLNPSDPSKPSSAEDSEANIHFESLVKSHRQHLRDCTDSGKNESKLLVNFTMKRCTSDRVNVTADIYLNELDEFMDRKLAGILDIKKKIGDLRAFNKQI
jgi:hypothetical protein